MEATENDALAGDAERDPFEDVPADAGGAPDPELVQQGELEGYNPSEDEAEGEGDPLAEGASADPLAEPSPGEFMEEPEESEPEPPAADEPEPDPEPEPEPSPDPEPDPEPEPEETKGKSERKPGGKRRRSSSGSKGERGYVVIQCDKDDNPVAIAGEVNARDAKAARLAVFNGMEDKEAALCAVPERYWKVKTLRAKTREVRDIEEE